MSVLDASALVELVRRGPHGDWVSEWLHGSCTLHLADSEVVAALAGLVRGGLISRARAARAADLVEELPIDRFPAQGLLRRTLTLAKGVSAYDAAYVALAEALGEPLITLDRRLARGAPPSVRVIVPPARG